MDQISGKLKRIGQSIANLRTKESEISILEIGDQALRGIKIDIGLEGILSDGLNSVENTKLWMTGGKIMAIKVGDGIRYYAALPKGTWPSFITLWILTTLLGGLPLTSASNSIWALIITASLVPIVAYFKLKKYFDAASEGGQKV